MKHQRGIALVVTMMVALLLFIALLAISSNLSLSGKRVTTDQKLSLEAQYAAESGLSVASAQLDRIGRELESFLNQKSGFELPKGTKFITLKTYLEKFCGKSLTGVVPVPGGDICTADLNALDWSNPTASPYYIFLRSDHIDPKNYPRGATPEAYWSSRLGPQSLSRTLKRERSVATQYSVSYGFVPERAVMLYDGAVRLVWRAMPILSRGALVKGGGELALSKLQQDHAGALYVDLVPPSFAHYMMFTNYQRASPGANTERVYFFEDTLFDGPVHTNDKFNFIGNPWFGDEVTSAGCEKEDPNHTSCLSKQPGYYYWDNASKTHVKVTPPVDPIPTAWARPEFSSPPKWDKDYIALPKTGNDQYQAARNGGIFVRDPDEKVMDTSQGSQGRTNIEAVTLSVATMNGKKYQFIQVHGMRNVGVETVPGRCEKTSPGGGGGGGGPPGGGGGPSVQRLLPGVRVLAGSLLGASAPGVWAFALKWLQPSAASAMRAQDNPCPPGQRWVPPRIRAKLERFQYAYRIDATGRVERNDGHGWVFHRDHFNGVVYVGRGGRNPKTGNFVLQGAGLSTPTSDKFFWKANWPRYQVNSPSDCPYTVTQESGKHACIEPSIADFMQLTVVGNDIHINRDITYEDRPCTKAPERQANGSVTPGNCPNLSAKNVLGVYSDKGAIAISRRAPQNLHIDGVLMSAERNIFYRGWNTDNPKGYLHLTGGIIQNWYGRFGRLDSSLGIKNGYGRKFVYDRRMKQGLSPPYFPKFESGLPWKGRAQYLPGAGFWKPVEGK